MVNLSIKYPFYSLSCICLLFFLTAGIFFNNAYINISEVSYIFLTLFFTISMNAFTKRIAFLLGNLLFLISFILFNLNNQFLLIAELIQVLVFFYSKEKSSNKDIIFSIILSSFLLHLFYIQQTEIDFRQHDLSGIITYMSQIINNGINWRDFNPWNMYYTFHQPLNFIILQYLYLFNTHIYQSSTLAYESLQYLSLFYVTSISILSVKIFRLLNIKKNNLYALSLLVSFNPTLTLFSGYISNDVATLFWSISSIYFLLCWYKNNTLNDIIFSAICFGLGTLSKLSILLYVPAFSILLLCKILTSKSKAISIQHICTFLIITIPLSLIWIIRNHILFDMQFYNIPDTSPMGQNFNFLTVYDRILDTSMIFKPFINAPFTADANIFLAIIKTELFGEWNFSKTNNFVIFPAFLLYFINLFIKVYAIATCFYLLFKRKEITPISVFFILTYIITWGYIIKYALDYPYICSTDYRLFTSLMLAELFIIAVSIKNKVASNILLTTSSVYAMLSALIYAITI